MPFLILSLIIQIALVVHIVKTGRNSMWIFVVLFFPLIGSIAYAIVELLPEFGIDRKARSALRGLRKRIRPERDLQQAATHHAMAGTVQNSLRLGAELLQRERFAEAAETYRSGLRGVHAEDPQLLLGVARAEFGLGHYAAVLSCLDRLKQHNPGSTDGEGHLLYARALQESGDQAAASLEYQALIDYYPGPEPACRYAQLLREQRENARARALLEEVIRRADLAGKHYQQLHRSWIQQARRELAAAD